MVSEQILKRLKLSAAFADRFIVEEGVWTYLAGNEVRIDNQRVIDINTQSKPVTPTDVIKSISELADVAKESDKPEKTETTSKNKRKNNYEDSNISREPIIEGGSQQSGITE